MHVIKLSNISIKNETDKSFIISIEKEIVS